jgi:hypothetical protein
MRTKFAIKRVEFVSSGLRTHFQGLMNITLEETAMAKQPEFRKYLPLEEWFRKQPTAVEHTELTFDQVEAILGTPLPKSATQLTTWWTNVQPKLQSHRTAWLNHGWRVAEFDQKAKWVKFVRVRP